MSHLFGAFARARLRDVNRGLIYNFEKDADGVYVRRRFWITPQAQREQSIGNAITFFFRPSLSQSMHRNALFSATYLAKFILGTLKRRNPKAMLERIKKNRTALRDHLKIVLANAPELAPQAAGILRQRYFARRRLPFVLPPQKNNDFFLFYQTEHAPNPESRVVLHAERDPLGMPRLEARIAFGELDIETVLRTHRLMKRQFEKSGTGELLYDEEALRAKLADDIRHFNSSAHQIGTTRMSADPQDGVVDANCRVHGVDNFFVAGTSVFPTSGHANPTLMLVALALRLADHLKTLPF
jgi:choline dehydrogenase-like flavoprotein